MDDSHPHPPPDSWICRAMQLAPPPTTTTTTTYTTAKTKTVTTWFLYRCYYTNVL